MINKGNRYNDECLPEPNRIFLFAIDGAGNIFFFDYRKNAT